jgi:hypothetical protein
MSMDNLNKLRSDDLRQRVLSADPESQTVIVEVNIPLPALQVAKSRLGERSRIGLAPKEGGGDDVKSIKRKMKKIFGAVPRFLPSSRSFIVDATGDQLRKVAELPEVLAVWPNTVRRV